MNHDPKTRLIDGAELRGQLAVFLADAPTTVYSRDRLARARGDAPTEVLASAVYPSTAAASPVAGVVQTGAAATAQTELCDMLAKMQVVVAPSAAAASVDESGSLTHTSEDAMGDLVESARARVWPAARTYLVVVLAALAGLAVTNAVLAPNVAPSKVRVSSPPLPPPPPSAVVRSPVPEARAPVDSGVNSQIAVATASESPVSLAAANPAAGTRTAVEALIAGRTADAIVAYRALVSDEAPVFRTIVRLLEQEAGQRAIQEGGTCCVR